jgi:hypothetical protein
VFRTRVRNQRRRPALAQRFCDCSFIVIRSTTDATEVNHPCLSSCSANPGHVF